MPYLLLSITIAYLAGAINFSILLFKILGKADPRKEFSGNPGVVNVYRQAGFLVAALVWLLDMGRAIGIGMLSLQLVSIDLAPWSGLALILGNRYPCFHGFRGGKGVANYLGFTAVISPLAAGISALAWLATFGLCRLPFVGSFVMVLVLGAGTLLACNLDPGPAAAILATLALIVHGHRDNISEQIRKGKGDNTNQG
jgi:glycerol-3-phosphate acyltransferase PlsY